MRTIQLTMMFALCLALFSGAVWARGTTVSVGETVPLGGTTTTTTTTTTTAETTAEEEEGSSEPIPQMQITPADGSTPSSTEGTEWENLGVVDTGETIGGESGETGAEAEATGGSTAGTTAAPSAQGTGTGCAPAFILMGAALALFASKN